MNITMERYYFGLSDFCGGKLIPNKTSKTRKKDPLPSFFCFSGVYFSFFFVCAPCTCPSSYVIKLRSLFVWFRFVFLLLLFLFLVFCFFCFLFFFFVRLFFFLFFVSFLFFFFFFQTQTKKKRKTKKKDRFLFVFVCP